MKGINQILLQIVMIVLLFTFVSVGLAVMGAVFEYALFAEFWHLAFIGFIMILVALTLMFLIYILDQSINSYRKLDQDDRKYGIDL